MGEYDFDDDDDDFANFDLDAAVASYTPQKRSNVDGGALANVTNVTSVSTPTPSFGGSSDISKRFKTPDASASSPPLSAATKTTSNNSPGSSGAGGDIPSPSKQDEQALLLANELSTIPMYFQKSVTQTLEKHFGHSNFRPGQLTVLHSLLGDGAENGVGASSSPRDACVFWATGAGKSLCYQLPPLHLNQVAIVISPLVSLMQDQCAKLNGRVLNGASGGAIEIATFLGSSQSDYQAEERALNGEFRLVYVTPEKLVGADGRFLDRLANMHQKGGNGRICLIAVDESHCVSEWGHDFRPEFLKIGSSIRTHPILSSIPLLALTATAVPRVQSDICKNLRLHPDATIAKKSFDRDNLKIVIRRKPKNGPLGAFEGIAKEMSEAIHAAKVNPSNLRKAHGKSTIVYCATKKEVEEITSIIFQALAHQLVKLSDSALTFEAALEIAQTYVRPYHAGLSHCHRTQAHTDFLIGKVTTIVATIAFGMGIDKPDIRRVIHWGPCKTVEEYYQQIGRASRDGLTGECIMYCDANDFEKFKSDFYLGKLSGEMKMAALASMEALKKFAMSTEACRRAALLEFFEEVPAFGQRCGTCDTCLYRKNNKDDFERDFQWEGARLLLFAIFACQNQPMSKLEIILKGGSVENYRYTFPGTVDKTIKTIKVYKEKMKKKKPISYFKDLLPALIGRGYVEQESRQNKSHQYAKSYLVYRVTPRGVKAIKDTSPIMLPVPLSVREQEQLEEEKKQRALQELEAAGVDLDGVPQNELELGEGETIAALKRWYTYVDSLVKRGSMERVQELDDLKSRIEAWRLDMAERYNMAPASVMEDHLVVKVAYATASLQSGSHMERDSLVAAGVRSNGIDELTAALREWSQSDEKDKLGSDGIGGDNDCSMSLQHGRVFTPTNSWRYSVYKPNKKTGLATWESSYVRFVKGEHPQTIAMTQTSGRPIQVSTVVGHILEALTQGRPVDLHRLSLVEPPPSKLDWENLARCELETGMNVIEDPATSGANGERFSMKDFLVPIMGNDFALKEYTDRTPEESANFSKWCTFLKWYLSLRRAKFEPTFVGNK